MAQVIISGFIIAAVLGTVTFFYYRQGVNSIRRLLFFQTLPYSVFPILFGILLDVNRIPFTDTLTPDIEGLMLFTVFTTTLFVFTMAVGGTIKGLRHHKKGLWVPSALIVPLQFIPYMFALTALVPFALLLWKAVDKIRSKRKTHKKRLISVINAERIR